MKIPILLSTLISVSLFATDISGLINKQACDQLIDKQVFTICYDYQKKGALYVSYRLDGTLVHERNIEKRPRFYNESTIPMKHRTKYADYSGSGLDRGHLAPDASFDYDEKALRKTYTMANVVPMYPYVNRKLWLKAEKLERKVAYSLGNVDVLNGVAYLKESKTIGKSGLSVPYAFWKMLYNDHEGYKRCFYIKNMDESSFNSTKLKDYEFDCSKITS